MEGMNGVVLKMESFAKTINDLTLRDYYIQLNLIARSVFRWKNLPNNINEKWIEKYLYYEGGCVFFKHKTKGLMVAKVNSSGSINYYDEPTKVQAYMTNEPNVPLENNKDCIIIPNNDLYIPTEPTVQLFAYRLADITRTIDVNVAAQKTPVVVACNERQKKSLEAVMAKFTGNELLILTDKNLDMNPVKAIDTKVPVVFPQLQVQKHDLWNEIMTRLGVNNANMDKRERLVTNEVEANNDQVQISADVMLKSRQEACKRINEMFNLDIGVELREGVYAAMDEGKGDGPDVC